MNAAKKRYENLKARGRCVICTATAAAGGVRCLSCAAKEKQRRADIFASGLCRTCGRRPYTTVPDMRFAAGIGDIRGLDANRQTHHCNVCAARRSRSLKAYYAKRHDVAHGHTRGTVGFLKST